MFHIYVIENTESSKYYIGQTVRQKNRMREHRYDLHRGKHKNAHLQRSWRAHGEQAFQFYHLVSFETKEEVDEAERFYIAWFRDLGICYNHMGGGEGNYQPDEETRRKLGWSKGLKIPSRGDHLRGIPLTAEHKEKLKGPRPSLQGRVFKPETLEAMSAARKGKPNPGAAAQALHMNEVRVFTPEYRKKLSDAAKGNTHCRGRTHSEETIAKMKNRVFTEEHRQRISDAQKARYAAKKAQS